MSALDVAGAVVWTFLAVTGTQEYVAAPAGADWKGYGILILSAVWLASVYCIARLFGAT